MLTAPSYLFTSESVTEGHPDKIADQISDAILDRLLEQDPSSRVACETMVTTGLVFIAGEITTRAYADFNQIVRDTVREIGYTGSEMGFDADTCSVISSIGKQSLDIAWGIDSDEPEMQGAGDQGMMFGYAVDETPTLMPAPIYYAHKLSQRLAQVRKDGTLDFLRPDGKTQVCIEYKNGVPHRVDNVVIACQHNPEIEYEDLARAITTEVIEKVIPAELIKKKTRFLINTTGRFVIGGPLADCGLTGRKIIQDTYGGMGNHGGGAFSGKDPSKVDRSGAYMARYIAKNVVAAEMAERCEVQIAYAIGIAEPISLLVTSFGTGYLSDAELTTVVKEVFDLRPYSIIKQLDLLKPIYKDTSVYGHFGRDKMAFPWEITDKIGQLREVATGLFSNYRY